MRERFASGGPLFLERKSGAKGTFNRGEIVKRFLRAALCFAPLLALVMAVNWYADPANLLRGGYEQRVAEIMASGENAANLRNMDDRAWIRAYAALRTQTIGTLALGSSHSMQITPELTGDADTFCAGVTGADLRDCVSIYRLFRQQGFAPARVILTVDPWFLCENTLEGRAMTDGYEAFCKEIGETPYRSGSLAGELVKWERKAQIFSVPYFQQSLEYLKKGLDKNRDPVPTTAHKAESAMRRADGSYSYEAAYRDAGIQAARRLAEDCIIAKPQFARDFTGVTPALERQLRAFLSAMQTDGAQVAVMLAPYHPVYYAHMAASSDYQPLLATEPLIRAIAEELQIPVFGAYDPAACGLSETDFYDAMHCSEEAMSLFYPQNLFA